MSKSKLEILLETIEKWNVFGEVHRAYKAYMEERKKLPQQGQEIDVLDDKRAKLVIQKFIGFTTNGGIVSEDIDGIIHYSHHYRIPTPKKKWKVVKDGIAFIVVEFNHETDLPIITTFED